MTITTVEKFSYNNIGRSTSPREPFIPLTLRYFEARILSLPGLFPSGPLSHAAY